MTTTLPFILRLLDADGADHLTVHDGMQFETTYRLKLVELAGLKKRLLRTGYSGELQKS